MGKYEPEKVKKIKRFRFDVYKYRYALSLYKAKVVPLIVCLVIISKKQVDMPEYVFCREEPVSGKKVAKRLPDSLILLKNGVKLPKAVFNLK